MDKEILWRIEKIEKDLAQLNYNFGVRISKLENLKTPPNKDFTASPKVCPQCYPNRNIKMMLKKGEYWICPNCSRCIEGKPS